MTAGTGFALPDWGRLAFNSGALTLNGGSNTAIGDLRVGIAAGKATLALTAGSITADDTIVGADPASVATVNHSGGSHTTTFLTLGSPAGATATYSMSNGATLSGQVVNVGLNGAGTFNQAGGTFVVATSLRIASAPSGTGVVNLSAGTLTAPGVYVGGNINTSGGAGTLNLTGGTMTVADQVLVWNANSAVNLNGGVLATGSLLLPAGPASLLTFNGGTWRHTGVSALFSNDFTVGAAGGTIDVLSPTTTLGLGGSAQPAPAAPIPGAPLAGAAEGSAPVSGQLTKTGAGILRITGSLGNVTGVNVNAGKIDFANATASPVKALAVAAGATAVVSAGLLQIGDPTTVVVPLSVVGSARLDLGTRAMTIATATPARSTTFNNVRALIVQAYHATGAGNNGDWAGPGITSTTAQANSSRAVGYALSDDLFNFADGNPDAFFGQPVTAGQALARLTLAGDANLDGTVDFNDLVRLAQNYNTTVSSTTIDWWPSGDFTYDGVTDFNDLVKLAQNYNTSLPSEPIPGAPADFQQDLAAAFAAVPQPAPPLTHASLAA
jgi:hypothetical protein